MNDKTLVERLLVSDFYGYQGRKEVEAANTLRREAATRIEALEAALRKSPLIGSTEDAAAFRKREDEWYKKYYLPLMESQP